MAFGSSITMKTALTSAWTLLLLSLIAAGFLALTRTEMQLARNALANARAEALVDGVRGIQARLGI